MLQIFAQYQLISSHPTSCIAVCWRLDDPDPLLQGPPIPQGGGAGYHCSIVSSTYHYTSYFALRYLIWSSFQYLILTCNLFLYTCFSCLKSTFFILSYQLHCCWLDDPHPFPGPTHSTGGRGGDVMTMTMAGGVGGGTRNLEHICIYIYTQIQLVGGRYDRY